MRRCWERIRLGWWWRGPVDSVGEIPLAHGRGPTPTRLGDRASLLASLLAAGSGRGYGPKCAMSAARCSRARAF